MNRQLTSGVISLLLLTLAATPVFAQQEQAEPAPAAQQKPKKPKALVTPHPEWMWPSMDGASPQGLADSQPGQFTEIERRALAGAMVAGSLPLIIYGLGKLANTQRDHTRDRQVDAHAAGASIFAGMGMLAQGASMLDADSPEAKRRRLAMANPSSALTINPILPLLERDAHEGKERRNITAGLVLAGGILGGAAIAALPVSDRTVDRRVLVGAGTAVALAGMGGAAYLYWTPPPEEDALNEAMRRQQQQEQRPHLKPKEEGSSK